MIHPIKEEIYISLYLIVYGIYIISTYDVYYQVIEKLKLHKFIKIISEIVFCLLQIVITYYFSYSLASGYIPIYFILFILVGVLIYYYFLKKSLKITIDKIMLICLIVRRKISSKIVHLFISSRILNVIKTIFVKLKNKKKKKELSLDN